MTPPHITITLDTPDADRIIELAYVAALDKYNLTNRLEDRRIVREFARLVANAKANKDGRVFREATNL